MAVLSRKTTSLGPRCLVLCLIAIALLPQTNALLPRKLFARSSSPSRTASVQKNLGGGEQQRPAAAAAAGNNKRSRLWGPVTPFRRAAANVRKANVVIAFFSPRAPPPPQREHQQQPQPHQQVRRITTLAMGIRDGLRNLLRKNKNDKEDEDENKQGDASGLDSILEKIKNEQQQELEQLMPTLLEQDEEYDQATMMQDEAGPESSENTEDSDDVDDILDALEMLIDDSSEDAVVDSVAEETTSELSEEDGNETPPSIETGEAIQGEDNEDEETEQESEPKPILNPFRMSQPSSESSYAPESYSEPRRVDFRAIDEAESIQERINRVKSGKMTESEKKAFLSKALSASPVVEERTPASSSEDIMRVFAPPAPLERGEKKRPLPTLDSDQQKKAFLDMVTNPDRFGRYKTYKSNTPKSDANRTSLGRSPIPDPFATIRPISSDLADANTTAVIPEDTITGNSSDPLPRDLGTRLGLAALETENRRKRALEMAEQGRIEHDLQEEIQATNLARQLQNDVPHVDPEEDEEALTEAEKLRRAAHERIREKERIEKLMEAQDEYWNKKLAKERAARKVLDEEERDSVKKMRYMTPQDLVLSGKKNFGWDSSSSSGDTKASDKSDKGDDKTMPIPGIKKTERGVGRLDSKKSTPSNNLDIPPLLKDDSLNVTPSTVTRREIDRIDSLKGLNSPLPTGEPSAPPPPPVLDAKEDKFVAPERDVPKKPPTAPSVSGETAKVFGVASKENNSVAAKAAASSSSPARKGPIRMELPFGDGLDNDDDEIELTDSMSIADVMKRTKTEEKTKENQEDRSKMWGIDMSKFMDEDDY